MLVAVLLSAFLGAKFRSTVDTDFSDGLAVATMNRQMAIFAQCDTVGSVESEFRIRRPRLDVMRFKTHAALAAVPAGVIAFLQYVFVPFFVLVTRCVLSRLFVAFVARVFIALLEVSSRSPFFRLGTALNTSLKTGALFWVVPCSNSVGAGLNRFDFGFVSAFFRTELALGTWGITKFFAAVPAGGEVRRERTFFRAILSLPGGNLARSGIERFAASLAGSKKARCRIATSAFVTAFKGAVLRLSMFRPGCVGYESLTAVLADRFNLFSCHIYLLN